MYMLKQILQSLLKSYCNSYESKLIREQISNSLLLLVSHTILIAVNNTRKSKPLRIVLPRMTGIERITESALSPDCGRAYRDGIVQVQIAFANLSRRKRGSSGK